MRMFLRGPNIIATIHKQSNPKTVNAPPIPVNQFENQYGTHKGVSDSPIIQNNFPE
jgi:hypothetical protein